jgi:ABC-type branched-subunit amino acid transport system permease subunit
MMMLELGFQSVTKHWQLLMGGVIVLVALSLPRGLVGLAGWRSARVERADD